MSYLLFWQVIFGYFQDIFNSDLATDLTIVLNGFTDVLDYKLKELVEDDNSNGIQEENHYHYGHTGKEWAECL